MGCGTIDCPFTEGASTDMSSPRKPLAALAAVTAALAVAVTATSANAAPTANPGIDPQVCTLFNTTVAPLGYTQFPGGASLTNVLTGAGATVGCTVAAPAAPAAPAIPFGP
jgi:hypothetical protein